MPRPFVQLIQVAALLLGLILGLPQQAMAQILPAQSVASEEVAAEAGAGPLTGLLEVLRDETAREALIAELERVTTEAGPLGEIEATAEAVPAIEPRVSIGTRIAQITQDIAEGLAAQTDQVIRSFSGNGNLLGGLAGLDLDVGERGHHLPERFRDLRSVLRASGK